MRSQSYYRSNSPATSDHEKSPVVTPDQAVIYEEDDLYTRFSPRRKQLITGVVTYCAFLSPIGSTMITSTIPEVAQYFKTSGSIINASNAIYMLAAGMSPFLVGQASQVYGRRWILIIASSLFFAFSIGTALSPNLESFFIFRMLTAYHGTAFLVVGNSCLGDIYTPTKRATGVGWFMLGFELGPILGPLFGGIIVTYCSWRDIFWLQSGLAGLGVALIILFLPETLNQPQCTQMAHLSRGDYIRELARRTSPLRMLKHFRYPNILFAGLGSSALAFNMYSFLTPITYVLNPRFGLTTPLQSALFYLAPGAGNLAGTFLGGRWADKVVRRCIVKRHGVRVPEDRLKSCLPFFGILLPVSMLIYGWSVQESVGGIALPVIMMFSQGFAQLFVYPSLNTYCLDVMQTQGYGSEIVAGNYFIRYMFAAAGSAACLPAIEKFGVGWFTTISVGFLTTSASLIWATTIWGAQWRKAIEENKGRPDY
ncbi:MFS transporter DHA1 family multidrug resistance protein [Penicillium angulare]|uniref:MFS transporter DHA1 family multidrug resistance protein n=1 Tax=Penicillium angulare TaxID=116970 RepID=UPI0025424236|nr:MFS transporter DHA1 family multidrug resistance protein [Penicillium angulare]KAJ5259328.1 MFS transporter DHA1 family multidrug resistance protein [Penicillium angulare]